MFFWLVETLQPLKLCSKVQWDPPTDFNGHRRQVSRRTHSWQNPTERKQLAEVLPKSSKRKSCRQKKSPACFLLRSEAQPSRSDQRSFSHPQCQHPEISISFLSGWASPASSSISVSSSSPHSCTAVEKDPVPFSSPAVAAATGDPDLPPFSELWVLWVDYCYRYILFIY